MSNLYELEKKAREIAEQKELQRRKLLTPEGMATTWQSLLQGMDFASFLSDLTFNIYIWLDFEYSLLLGVNMINIGGIYKTFDVRLPTTEEWLQGILLKIVGIEEVLELQDFLGLLTDITTLIDTTFLPEVAEGIKSSLTQKCYYGRSKYDTCYVDPSAVAEFMRRYIPRKYIDLNTLRSLSVTVRKAAEVLEVNKDLAEFLATIPLALQGVLTSCFMLDYGYLDISPLCEEGAAHSEPLGRVYFTDLDANPRIVDVDNPADVGTACVLDHSLLDYCYLYDRREPYQHPAKEIAPGIIRNIEPVIATLASIMAYHFKRTYMANAMTIANYATLEERLGVKPPERVERWGQITYVRYTIESIAKGILDKYRLPPMIRRDYINALLNLWGMLNRRHRWGDEMYKYATDDEIKSVWKEVWSARGLDPNILQELLDRLYDKIKHLSWFKYKVGKATKELRFALAQR